MIGPALVDQAPYKVTLVGTMSGQEVINSTWFRWTKGSTDTNPSGVWGIGDLLEAIYDDCWYNTGTLMSGPLRQRMDQGYTLLELQGRLCNNVLHLAPGDPYVPQFSDFYFVTVPSTFANGNSLGPPLPLQCTASYVKSGSAGGYGRVRNGTHLGPPAESEVGVGSDANILTTTARSNWLTAARSFTDIQSLVDPTPTLTGTAQPVIFSPRVAFLTSPAGGAFPVIADKMQPYVGSQNSRKTRQP